MFKYLWMVIQDLFLTVTYTTLMHAMLCRVCKSQGRIIHSIGLGIGVLASVALALVKYNTKLIISSRWNHVLYAIIMGLTVLFLILTVIRGRRETSSVRDPKSQERNRNRQPNSQPNGKPNSQPTGTAEVNRQSAQEHPQTDPGAILLAVTGSLLSAVLIFYSLPGVLLYPFSFNTMGQGYLSSYYLVRMAGWLGALILLLVYSRLLYHCAAEIRPYRLLPILLATQLLSFTLYCFGRFFVPWVNRAKWLGWSVKYSDEAYGWIGSWMMFTANHAMLFLWIGAGLTALLAICLFRQGTILREKYDHAAQLRKLKARNRRWRRIAVWILVCLILFTVVLTVVKTDDTKQVELSAPEQYTVDEAAGEIRIPAEAVNDGHLHRFEYRTAKNIDVRWIVVKKPNSASWGVGLDACEVCGNAGYFERNGQIVCKRCDVVMNINTIGFKGGCNPIPLPYEVRDGNLVFRLEDITAGEKEFR